jgi:hypothetical protein
VNLHLHSRPLKIIAIHSLAKKKKNQNLHGEGDATSTNLVEEDDEDA